MSAPGLPAAAPEGVGPPVPLEVVHRVRISSRDAHYGGGLVDGAKILRLFGDVATELMIRLDGDEGLLAAYEHVDFDAPTHAGDFLEVRAELIAVGNTSRRVALSARRYIAPSHDGDSAADLLDNPVPVCRATLVAVVPAGRQRRRGAGQLQTTGRPEALTGPASSGSG